MSLKAMAWAYDQRVGDPALKSVLVVIANFADEQGYCWPAMQVIASMSEVSIRTARRYVKSLEAKGFLIVDRERIRDSGARTSNSYRLPLEARELPLAAPPPVKLTDGKTVSGGPGQPCPGAPVTAVTPYELSLEPSVERLTLLPPMPDWLPTEAWEGFIADRKERKKAMTSRAKKLALARLAELRAQGHDPRKVLEQSIEAGWQKLYPLKVQKPDLASLRERNRANAEEWIRMKEAEA